MPVTNITIAFLHVYLRERGGMRGTRAGDHLRETQQYEHCRTATSTPWRASPNTDAFCNQERSVNATL
jgi:hypothetical protein